MDPTIDLPLIGIAISGGKASKSIVDWALEKFGVEDQVVFKLIHVHRKSLLVPTEMGNRIQISRVREEVAKAYRSEMKLKASKMLSPFVTMCNERSVKAETAMIESDDVPDAIALKVAESGINKLIIGDPYRLLVSKAKKISTRISAAAPTFCTVYHISNGRVSFIRPAVVDGDGGVHSPDEISSPLSNGGSFSVSSFMRGNSRSETSSLRSDSMGVPRPPAHFICPILEDVMVESCVAADGYAYDRGAISGWLQSNDTSFMTGLPLPNKDLLPNFTLQAAIDEWRSNNLT